MKIFCFCSTTDLNWRRAGAMLLVAAAFSLSFASCPAMAAVYYVHGSSTTGTGSEASPWTLLQLNDNMAGIVAGDHIYFKRGDVFTLEPGPDTQALLYMQNRNGTAADPIVFAAYGTGAAPVLDCIGPTAPVWQSEGNSIYSTVFPTTNANPVPHLMVHEAKAQPATTILELADMPAKLGPNGILIRTTPTYANFWVQSINGLMVAGLAGNDFAAGNQGYIRYLENNQENNGAGFTVTNIITSGAAANAGLTEYGQWYWDPATNKIFLYAAQPPNSTTVQVNRVREGIRVQSSSYLVFRDLQIRNANNEGIVFYDSDQLTAERLTITRCGLAGITMWNVTDSIIQDNSFDADGTGISLYKSIYSTRQTTGNQIRNNTITNIRGAGVLLIADQDKPVTDVSNNLITKNTITNCTTMSYDNGGVYSFAVGSNTVDANVVKDCGSPHLRSGGIQVDMARAPMTITNNTFADNSVAGVAVSGSSHIITGNTLSNNGSGLDNRGQLMFFTAGTAAADCTVTTNTFRADRNMQFIVAEAGNCTGHTIDYNTYTFQGATGSGFYWPCTSPAWMDFPTWQSSSGQDAHSSLKKIPWPLTAQYLLLLLQ